MINSLRYSWPLTAGPVARYVTDPAAGLPVTIDDGVRKYVWGQGLPYAASGSTLEVYHTDRLGSVRAVTDATGAVTATWRTDEFGVPTATTGTTSQPFAFTGEPRDATGLSYFRARYYDPSLGRFMSRDPFAGFTSGPLSLNRYSYVENNPATLTDPSGQVPPIAICATPWTAAACVAAAGEAISFVGGVIADIIGIVAVVGVVNAIDTPSTAPDIWASTVRDDWTKDDGWLLTKNRQTRKVIRGLEEQVDKHEEKLRENPGSQTETSGSMR